MAEKRKIVQYRNNRTGAVFAVPKGSVEETRVLGKMRNQRTEDDKPLVEQVGKPQTVESLSRRERARRRRAQRREAEQNQGQQAEAAGQGQGQGG